MNWNLIAFAALMVFFILGALVMLYFQWVDGYVRKWRWERKAQEMKENTKHELMKACMDFRYDMKDMNKSGWLYKFFDWFLKKAERKASEK